MITIETGMGKAKDWGPRIALAALAVMLVLTTYLCSSIPIFTDEVSTKLILARYFPDSGIAISLFPTCFAEFTTPIPALFVPFRIIDSLLYGNLSWTLKLRVVGILQYLLLIGLLARAFWVILSPSTFRLMPVLLATSALTLGQIPFIMVLNRNELPLAILTVILVLFSLSEMHKPGDQRAAKGLFPWFKALFFLTLSAWIFSVHPKALFLAPLLISLVFTMSVGKNVRVVILAGLVLQGIVSMRFFQAMIACPLDPEVGKVVTGQVSKAFIGAGSVLDAATHFLSSLYDNRIYFRSASFTEFRTIHLPGVGENGMGAGLSWRWIFGIWNYSFFLLMGALGLCAVVFGAIMARNRITRAQSNPYLPLLLGCGASVVGLAVLSSRKATYDFGLLYPLFLIGVALSVRAFREVATSRGVRFATGVFLVMSLISQTMLFYCFRGYRDQWTKGGLIEGIHSGSSAFRSQETAARLTALASKCGLSPTADNWHLVIDDVTYPHFLQGRLPYHAQFLFPSDDKAKAHVIEFLRQRNSSGYLADCKHLPAKLAAQATSDRGICCLSKQDLQ